MRFGANGTLRVHEDDHGVLTRRTPQWAPNDTSRYTERLTGRPPVNPRLAPTLSRPIRWDIIAEQEEQMIQYATAIRAGIASTEAIHPTYQAMIEVGRAQRTIFVA
ncbi:Tn3 family transposase [Dactylosporangium sp. NPDC051484]|uniref:Tn3 family transposase n=1 Tax=Dactylosporangium sp. NPDC051484 TaxID=3154942 RepID=UPI00344D187A